MKSNKFMKAASMAAVTMAIALAATGCGKSDASGSAAASGSTAGSSTSSTSSSAVQKTETKPIVPEGSASAVVPTGKDGQDVTSVAGATMQKAYAEIISRLVDNYGEPRQSENSDYTYGVSYTRLLDFDGDGTDELICAVGAEDDKETPTKYMVWGWNGKNADMLACFNGHVAASDISSGFALGTRDNKWYISDGEGDAFNYTLSWWTVENGKMVEGVRVSAKEKDAEQFAMEYRDELTGQVLEDAKADELQNQYVTDLEYVSLNNTSSESDPAVNSAEMLSAVKDKLKG